MPLNITDWPLEVFELILIFALGVGLYRQQRTLRRDKSISERKLTEAHDELKHLRRMLDQILLVEKGYAHPADQLDPEPEKPPPRKHTPTGLF